MSAHVSCFPIGMVLDIGYVKSSKKIKNINGTFTKQPMIKVIKNAPNIVNVDVIFEHMLCTF